MRTRGRVPGAWSQHPGMSQGAQAAAGQRQPCHTARAARRSQQIRYTSQLAGACLKAQLASGVHPWLSGKASTQQPCNTFGICNTGCCIRLLWQCSGWHHLYPGLAVHQEPQIVDLGTSVGKYAGEYLPLDSSLTRFEHCIILPTTS